MKQADGSADDGRVFPATQWSLVARAGSADADLLRDALGTLLTRYLPALRVHLSAGRRLPPERVDDLLQGFISEKVIERNLIALADRSRGKFRTFLLAALDRYCIDQHRAGRALKRAPAEAAQRLDDQAFAIAGPDETEQRDAAFDFEWARLVLKQAVNAMRDECASEKPVMWELFEQRVLRPAMEDAPPVDYEQLVARLGLASPTQAANLLVTAKRTLVRHLRAQIALYAGDEDEIDQELTDLRQVLSTAGSGG